jgi:hypothetical protein
MIKYFSTILCLLFVITAFAQSKDEKAIRAVMREEERAWNSGNIEAYVDLYAPSDSTRMIYSSMAGSRD